MTCWRCGLKRDAYDGRLLHKVWCSDGTPNDCTHCGGNPCRWWCLGDDDRPMLGLYRHGVTGLHETVRELTGSPA